MLEDVRWLTYDEVARELGIVRESARQLAIRKRWARRKGNDGKARVGVPEDEFQVRTAEATSSAPSDSPSNDPSDDTGHDTSAIQVLTQHIRRLEGEIEGLKQERDLERVRAAQVDVLKALLEAERKRAEEIKDAERHRIEELKAERDRWHAQAERLALAPSQIPAPRQRSWWPWRRAS